MPGSREIKSEAPVRLVAFTKDGTSVRGTCADGKVRVWNAGTGTLERTDVAENAATRRLLSPDEVLLAASTRGAGNSSLDTVRVKETAGKERFAVPAGVGGISAMAFSPSGGTLVAASYDTDVRAWNTRNGELVRLIEEIPVSTFAMEFTPDGKYLATAGVDRIVYLWDAKTWKLARKLTGQPEMILSLDFSRDGRMLATGGFSELTSRNPVKILLWDVAPGRIARSLDAKQAVSSVAFSPDGKLLASTGGAGITLWEMGASN
jgi:Tol biopolymer transport system component